MSVYHSDFEFDGNCLFNFTGLSIAKAIEVLAWRNHSEVRRWMYSNAIISETEHLKFINDLRTDNANYYWRLDGKTGIGIGVLYFNKVNFPNGTCELGMYTNPFNLLKGGGLYIGKIAKILAFDIGKLSKIRLEVFAENTTAIGIDRLLGFKEESPEQAPLCRPESSKGILAMSVER